MYSLRLTSKPDEIDLLSAELWDMGTIGIREIDGNGDVTLIAAFESNAQRSEINRKFAAYTPQWIAEEVVDWVAVTREAWPAREIGDHFFLAPHWATVPTPQGRLRLIHNPGLACGTGEHPCTQLALIALEKFLLPGCTVVDVGAGSGILSIAALQLGAARAIGVDIDCSALAAARENFKLNDLAAELVCGSAETLADACCDLTIANISGTVLLGIWEDLLRITRRTGHLILTGFSKDESKSFQKFLPRSELFASGDWRCLIVRSTEFSFAV